MSGSLTSGLLGMPQQRQQMLLDPRLQAQMQAGQVAGNLARNPAAVMGAPNGAPAGVNAPQQQGPMSVQDVIAQLRGPNPLVPINPGLTDTNLTNYIYGTPQLLARLRPEEGGPQWTNLLGIGPDSGGSGGPSGGGGAEPEGTETSW